MRISLIILLCFLSFAVEAKEQAWDCIYQSGYKQFSVVDVERSDTATIISLRCKMRPGDPILLPNKKMYLDDELHNRYKLRYAVNIVPGDTIRCPYSGEYDFSLVFDPLPKKVKIFDLRAVNAWYSAFDFWGIHKDKNISRKIKHKADDIQLGAGEVCHSGSKTCVVKGYIKNYDSSGEQEVMSLEVRTSSDNGRQENRRLKENISDDGYFNFVAPVENKCWTYIEGRNTKTPVLLIPGDTIMLTIENYQEIDMHATYSSLNGNNTMASLMMADPKWMDWDLARARYEGVHPAELWQDMEKRIKETNTFADYLSWKHHLSQTESHLLRLHMHSFIYEISISRLNTNFNEVYLNKEARNPRGNSEDFSSLPEVVNSYSFLKNINTGDYSYFVLPYQYLLLHLPDILPVRLASTKTLESRFMSLEKYLGQELDEEWRKRINF